MASTSGVAEAATRSLLMSIRRSLIHCGSMYVNYLRSALSGTFALAAARAECPDRTSAGGVSIATDAHGSLSATDAHGVTRIEPVSDHARRASQTPGGCGMASPHARFAGPRLPTAGAQPLSIRVRPCASAAK